MRSGPPKHTCWIESLNPLPVLSVPFVACVPGPTLHRSRTLAHVWFSFLAVFSIVLGGLVSGSGESSRMEETSNHRRTRTALSNHYPHTNSDRATTVCNHHYPQVSPCNYSSSLKHFKQLQLVSTVFPPPPKISVVQLCSFSPIVSLHFYRHRAVTWIRGKVTSTKCVCT